MKISTLETCDFCLFFLLWNILKKVSYCKWYWKHSFYDVFTSNKWRNLRVYQEMWNLMGNCKISRRKNNDGTMWWRQYWVVACNVKSWNEEDFWWWNTIRVINILSTFTRGIEATGSDGEAYTITIPEPAVYVIQKILTNPIREPQEKSKGYCGCERIAVLHWKINRI